VTGSSLVDFGTHNTGEMSDVTQRWITVDDNYYWQTTVIGVMIGDSGSTA